MSSFWCTSAPILGLLTIALGSCSAHGERAVARIEIADDLDARLAKFAPVVIETDLSELSDVDRQVLDELIAASVLMGEIFLRQAWHGNAAMLASLKGLDHPQRDSAITYFQMMVGPWDRLDETNFLGGGARPEGAGYYPPTMESAEFVRWVAEHPQQNAGG